METKKCTQCGVVKSLDDFYKKKSGRLGYEARCKACACASSAKWAEDNNERYSANQAAYRAANHDGLQEYHREYRAAHPKTAHKEKEKQKAVACIAAIPESPRVCSSCGVIKVCADFYRREPSFDGYRTDCKECVKGRSHEWSSTHPEQLAESNSKWRGANPEKVRVTRNKANAKWAKAHPEDVNARCAVRRAKKLRATPTWANEFFIEEIYDLAQRRTKATGFKWHVDHIVPLRSKLVCGLHVENNLQVIPAVKNMSKGNRHWPDMPEKERHHG